jgi:acyl-coenzyme A synthetase/AMP-(fatty) acid ligase
MIERYGINILYTAPTAIRGLMRFGENWPNRHDLSSLRLVLSAGEALPPELYRRWKETFAVEVLDGIGSAEMFHIYISNTPGEVVPGSLGRLVPGYDARIVGPDGADVAPGEAGTLWIKGESAAILYWQAHEKSKEVLRGDWVTGDHAPDAGALRLRGGPTTC